jgi:hypothetical protein
MAVIGNWKEEQEAAKKRIVIYLAVLVIGLVLVVVAEKKFNEAMEDKFSERNYAVEHSSDE